jgi:hypothetical protein
MMTFALSNTTKVGLSIDLLRTKLIIIVQQKFASVKRPANQERSRNGLDAALLQAVTTLLEGTNW